MPYGGTTPAQDKKIERCVKQVMADPKFKPKKGSKKSAAVAVCKSRIMGEGRILENVPLKFTAEITESLIDTKKPDERKVNGTLLLATTSRNGITYEIDEINKASFNGRPYTGKMEMTASLNHTDDVTDNVAIWHPVLNEGKLDYVAKVFNTQKHPYVTELLDKGLIRHVSLEALASHLEESKDKIIARGLDITGMGFVKTPGVKEVTLAIAEAFNADSTKVDHNIKKDKEDTGEVKNMEEQEEKPKEEPKEEETTTEEKANPVLEELKKISEKLDKTEQFEKELEAIRAEIKEKKTKGQVTQETKPKEEPHKLFRTKEGKFPKNKTKGVDLYGVNVEDLY